ncbi:MAG: methyltransferase domain-containing protein [bacterium]|nr:methyltransferase domain-containing protein [bacterium]
MNKKRILSEEAFQKRINQILDLIESKGWDESKQFLLLEFPEIYKKIFDPFKADWLYLLPISEMDTVLNLESGWNSLSFLLARVCKSVFSIDTVFERIKFINLRIRHEKVLNLSPIMGDILNLPFSPSSFNLIVMDGGLKQIGTLDVENDPLEVQKNLLRQIFDLLKEEGYLYLRMENRYKIDFILRGKDSSGLQFINLMPRTIANLYTKIIKGEPYRAYVHSYFGYRRLLREAGFKNIQFYAPIPSYSSPIFIIPLDKRNISTYFFKYILSRQSIKWKIMVFLARVGASIGIYPYITPYFIIIAKKSSYGLGRQ